MTYVQWPLFAYLPGEFIDSYCVQKIDLALRINIGKLPSVPVAIKVLEKVVADIN
jgi:hypothetical protein